MNKIFSNLQAEYKKIVPEDKRFFFFPKIFFILKKFFLCRIVKESFLKQKYFDRAFVKFENGPGLEPDPESKKKNN